MPGDGSIILSQTIYCKKPVYIGDEITAKVTIASIDRITRKVKIIAECQNQNKDVVMQGVVMVLIRKQFINKER